MKKRFEDREDSRLHALLQVKRFECPDTRRWQQFERGLEQKQLAAITGTKGKSLDNWWRSIFRKKLAYVLAVVTIFIVGKAAVRQISSTYNNSYYDRIVDVASGSSRSYVCDILTPDCSFLSDHGTSLSFNGRGVGYVRDAITANTALF